MYQVKLSFGGLGVWFYPRFLTNESLLGTTRPITVLVGGKETVRVQVGRNSVYIITFRGGGLRAYDGKIFEGLVEIDFWSSPIVKIRWKTKNSNSVAPRPPCSIRKAIFGIF